MTKHKETERIILDKEEKQTLIEEREVTNEVTTKNDECCSCRDIWMGYKSCLDFTYVSIKQCLGNIKRGISCCFGACIFPIKERCCNCCDDIDRDLNPYKNPNYNPYDHL